MVLKKLTEILFCFRLNKIAMVADIEKKNISTNWTLSMCLDPHLN